MIKHVTVQEAHERAAKGTAYVDVRSVPEFEQAHPEGAFNVPLLDMDPATRQMQPNPAFVDVMRATFAPGTPLLIGCQAGARSLNACQVLEAAGFTDLTNVLGGFGGSRTGDTGWVQAGLPVSREAVEGRDYASLQRKTGEGR